MIRQAVPLLQSAAAKRLFLSHCFLLALIAAASAAAGAEISIEEGYLITYQAIEDFAKELLGPEKLSQISDRPRFRRNANAIALASIKPYVSSNALIHKYGSYAKAHDISSTNQEQMQLVANLRRRLNEALSAGSGAQWQFAENLGLFLGVLQRFHAVTTRNSEPELDYLLLNATEFQEVDNGKQRAYNASMEFLRGLFAPVQVERKSRALELFGLCDQHFTVVFMATSTSMKMGKWKEQFVAEYLLSQQRSMQLCEDAKVYRFNGDGWSSDSLKNVKIDDMVRKHSVWPKDHKMKGSDQLKQVNGFLALKADVGGAVHVFLDSDYDKDATNMNDHFIMLNHLAKERSIAVNVVIFTDENTLPIAGSADKAILDSLGLSAKMPKVLPLRSLIGISQATGGFHYVFHKEEPVDYQELARLSPSVYSNYDSMVAQAYIGQSMTKKTYPTLEFNTTQSNAEILVLATCSARTNTQKFGDIKLHLTAKDTPTVPLKQAGPKAPFFYAVISETSATGIKNWQLSVDHRDLTIYCHARIHQRSNDPNSALTAVQGHFIYSKGEEHGQVVTGKPAELRVLLKRDTAKLEGINATMLDLDNFQPPRKLDAHQTHNMYSLSLWHSEIPKDYSTVERFSISLGLRLHATSKEASIALPHVFLAGPPLANVTILQNKCPELKFPPSTDNRVISTCFSSVDEGLTTTSGIESVSIPKSDSKKPLIDYCNPCATASSAGNWSGVPLKCIACIPKPKHEKPMIAERVSVSCIENLFERQFNAAAYRPPELGSLVDQVLCSPGLSSEDCATETWSVTYKTRSHGMHKYSGVSMQIRLLEDRIDAEYDERLEQVKFTGKCCIMKFMVVAYDPIWGTFVYALGDTGGPGPSVEYAKMLTWIIVALVSIIVIVVLIVIIAYCIRKDAKKADYSTVANSEQAAASENAKSQKIKRTDPEKKSLTKR